MCSISIYTILKILGYTLRPRFSPPTRSSTLSPSPRPPSLPIFPSSSLPFRPKSPFPFLLYRNPLILAKPECQVHILQTLRSRPLQQIINRSINNHPRAARMDTEASDLNAVFAGDVLQERRLARDFDELFAGVPVLVKGADVAGGHGPGEGGGDGMLGRARGGS